MTRAKGHLVRKKKNMKRHLPLVLVSVADGAPHNEGLGLP